MTIIGVTGPTGAGKDTSADYLAKAINIPHISGSTVLKDMLRSAGLPITKEGVRNLSIFLRSQFGPEIIIDRTISRATSPHGIIISGFRSPDEAQSIKKRGGIIIYIEANAEIRHSRITLRHRTGDPFSSKEFAKIDTYERQGHQDENLDAIRSIADLVIPNEGTLDQLHDRLQALCKTIQTSS